MREKAMRQRVFWVPLVLSVGLLTACDSKDESQEVQVITPAAVVEEQTGPVEIKVALNTVNMRAEPSMNSKVIAKLPLGSSLTWLEQVSDTTSPVKLRGVRYNDPWLYVQTDKDEKGWVYLATVDVSGVGGSSDSLRTKLMERRIDTFFGPGLASEIRNYRQGFANATTSQSLAEVYTFGQQLRDKVVRYLEEKAQADVQPPADMRWLDQLLPAFKHAVVAEGTQYYLFIDYNAFKEKALQTQGNEDDAFMDLNLSMFPSGEEGFFPIWVEQTWDYGGESLLGQGHHTKVLDQLESIADSTAMFGPQISETRERLVQDITSEHSKFREKVERWKAELKEILDKDYKVLTDADKQALKARLG